MDEMVTAFRRGAFASGGISLAVGVMLLVWPDKTLLVVAALIGVLLVAIGIARVFEAFAAKALPGAVRALRGLTGLLMIILGVAVLRHPADSLTVITVLLGIAWMLAGLAEVAFGFTSGGQGRGRTGSILLGVLHVIAGLVLFLWPQTSLTVVVWVVGVWLIAIGLIELLLAVMTRATASPSSG